MIRVNHLITMLLLVATVAAQAQSTGMKVVVHQLETAPVTRDLELSGTLRSLREAQLSLAAEALVSEIYVDVGARVEQGQLLLALDSSLVAREHQRAKARVNAAQISLDEAQRLLAQAVKLRPNNHISQTEVESRKSAVTLAEAQLEQAKADADLVAERLAKHRLYAPFDGVISARWIELGQWLNRGDRVFTLVSLDQLRLDVRLPQEQLQDMNKLSSVYIKPDTDVSVEIAAKVESVVPVSDRSRSVLVRVAATEPAEALFPGASARAVLQFEHATDAIVVPRDAVLRNADGNYSVFVVEQGTARVRQVELGLASRHGYLVKEGLQAGDQVVVRGNEVLRDGESVEVTARGKSLTGSEESQR